MNKRSPVLRLRNGFEDLFFTQPDKKNGTYIISDSYVLIHNVRGPAYALAQNIGLENRCARNPKTKMVLIFFSVY